MTQAVLEPSDRFDQLSSAADWKQKINHTKLSSILKT